MANNQEYSDIKSVVVRFSALGDILLALPLMGALKDATDGEVAFVTREVYRPIVERHPDIETVYTIPGTRKEREEELPKLVDRINTELTNVEYAFDIHSVALSRCTMRRIDAKIKAKYKKNGVCRLILASTGIDFLPKPTRTVQDNYASSFSVVGNNIEVDKDFRLPVNKDVVAKIKSGFQLKSGFIAIAPNARYDNKSWQKDNFLAVTKRLIADGHFVVLFGDCLLDESWDDFRDAGVVDLSGKTPLETLPEALSGAAALICNDSALAHLAPLLDVPVVDIFGATNPRFGFAATGEKSITLYADYPCSPCTRHGKRSCWRGDKACFSAISPDDVLNALGKVLSDDRAA